MYLPPKKATVTNIRRKVRLKKAGTVIETRQETGLAGRLIGSRKDWGASPAVDSTTFFRAGVSTGSYSYFFSDKGGMRRISYKRDRR